MSWLDSIGSFISDNSGWLKPVADFGLNLWSNNQQEDNRNETQDYLSQMEDEDYANQLAERNDYLAWMKQNQAISNANAAAKRAAMMKAASYYRPYMRAGRKLLPKQTAAYGGGLDLMAKMLANLATPDTMGIINMPMKNQVIKKEGK